MDLEIVQDSGGLWWFTDQSAIEVAKILSNSLSYVWHWNPVASGINSEVSIFTASERADCEKWKFRDASDPNRKFDDSKISNAASVIRWFIENGFYPTILSRTEWITGCGQHFVFDNLDQVKHYDQRVRADMGIVPGIAHALLPQSVIPYLVPASQCTRASQGMCIDTGAEFDPGMIVSAPTSSGSAVITPDSPSWWSKQSTLEKTVIVVGGIAIVGGLGYLAYGALT